MGAFVIAYVPQVEEVSLVTKVKGVDNVALLEKALQLDNVSNVERVQTVDNVDWVATVDNVNTVHDVRKLPHPFFPLKKYNYQPGGTVHVTAEQNHYQAVYVPEQDVEFKGVHLSCTSYNIEDTYDVMIGARYIIQNSSMKEMAEYRMMEVYEVVPAGTPIVIHFHNNSGLEKYLQYDFVCLVDTERMAYPSILNWVFYWEGLAINVNGTDTCALHIAQPGYVNLESYVTSFEIDVINMLTGDKIATIAGSSGGSVSDYVETDPAYSNMGLLGRVNIIGITNVIRHAQSIEVDFKNLSNTNNHPIEIRLVGRVLNQVVGGV